MHFWLYVGERVFVGVVVYVVVMAIRRMVRR